MSASSTRRLTPPLCWPVGPLVLGLTLACATAPPRPPAAPSKPVVEFPGPEAVAAIAAVPAPVPRHEAGPMPPAGWTVELGEAATSSDEPWTPSTVWDRAVLQSVGRAGKRARFTRALSCVAREHGRYALQFGKAPPGALHDFIAGACGASAPQVDLVGLRGEVSASVSDEALLQRWRDGLESELIDRLPTKATVAGFALVRRGRHAYAAVAYAEPPAELEPFSLTPGPTGEVVVSGRLAGDFEYVAGYVNRGLLGVDACEVAPGVARPSFRITCRIAPEDAASRIDLAYARPHRVLARPFARFVARRSSVKRMELREEADPEARPAGSATEVASAILEALNLVRARASLAPVRLASAQSEIAASVARHFFAAGDGPDGSERMDAIALGLLAGWRVHSGLIRDGGFASALVAGTRDVGRWLSAVLATPLGRASLLVADVEEIAIGPVLLSAPDAVGAVVAGYAFHHGSDHAEDVLRLLRQAKQARSERGLEEPRRLARMDEVLRSALSLVNEGRLQPQEALQVALEDGARRFGASMRGYVLEATSLDGIRLPVEVVDFNRASLDIGVTHHRPPGAAWAQYVVLVVFIDYTRGSI